MYNKVPTLIYQPQEKKVDSYISRKMSLIDKISIYKQNSSTFNKKEMVCHCRSYSYVFLTSCCAWNWIGPPICKRFLEEGVNALSVDKTGRETKLHFIHVYGFKQYIWTHQLFNLAIILFIVYLIIILIQ